MGMVNNSLVGSDFAVVTRKVQISRVVVIGQRRFVEAYTGIFLVISPVLALSVRLVAA